MKQSIWIKGCATVALVVLLIGSAGVVLGERGSILSSKVLDQTRNPVNVVTVIDKSGSMTWGPDCCYNENIEPPYSSDPPDNCQPPYDQDFHYQPYIYALWSNWMFFEYLIGEAPPMPGYEDYGGIIFYSDPDYPSGVPGIYAVITPTPIQRPEAKQFWWHEHLARQEPGGRTSLGPGIQMAMEMLAAMPDHPDPALKMPLESKVKSTKESDKNYMIVFTDGRPNGYWTPRPEQTATGPGWNNPVEHVREIARRSALQEPWNQYSEANDITIFTIGLGAAVDAILLRELADPFQPEFMGGTPTPEHANHGQFFWATTQEELVDVYENIAAIITESCTPAPTPGLVRISMAPENIQVEAGQTFLVEIQVDASRHEVDVLDVHFDFNPIFLRIDCIAPISESGWQEVMNEFDNISGTMDYRAVKQQDSNNRSLRACTVIFTALELTSETNLEFSFEPPDRETEAEFQGVNYCNGNVVNASVRIVRPWIITGME